MYFVDLRVEDPAFWRERRQVCMSISKKYDALPPGLKPRLLDRAAAAAYCAVSVRTFITHVPVEPILVGSKRVWDRMAIDRWIEGRPNLRPEPLETELRRLLDDMDNQPFEKRRD
jgi:hypothetical protein